MPYTQDSCISNFFDLRAYLPVVDDLILINSVMEDGTVRGYSFKYYQQDLRIYTKLTGNQCSFDKSEVM